MKNIITTAALLAAGTAFTNAAELTLDNATGYVWLNDELTLKAKAGLSLEGSAGGYTLSGADFFGTTSENRSQGTIALIFDASKLTTAALTPLITLDSTYKWGLGLSEAKAFSGTWKANSGDGIRAFFNTGPVPSTGDVTVTITMNDSGSQISMGDAATFWSSNTLKGKIASNSIVINSLAASALKKMVIWNVGAYGDQATTGTAYTAIAGNIPEPSAFGLLAGIGALALVASRRRRKA